MRLTFSRVAAPVAYATAIMIVCAGVASPQVAAQSGDGWKLLFNGKDLTGWTVAAPTGRGGNPTAPVTPANWKVDTGAIVGGEGGGRGSLVTTEQFKDFELELEFMLTEHGTKCSAELVGEKQENGSEERSCLYNSGISFRTGYQLNLGRREAGEYIGIVVHRKAPGAIRGNVLWLDKGDDKFPNLRKKQEWNTLRISAKGPHLMVTLNGTKICDVTDDPTDPAEAKWKEAGPISLQWPPAGESGGAQGFVKYRNIRIRTL
jgi:hypothetical protein